LPRYGFNVGSEKDDEIFIGAYTAEYWEYDSRLGRRWNVDPIVDESISSFATYANNPMFNIDPLGLSPSPGAPLPREKEFSEVNPFVWLMKTMI
jgi:RHS repeat-associated protein